MSILAADYSMKGKMTRVGLICLLLVSAFGCDSDTKSDRIMGEEEYARYLISIYVAEAKLNTLTITPDSAMKLFQPFEASLQNKFEVTDSLVMKTHEYYLNHPRELEKVYNIVLDSLNLRQQRLQGQTQ